MAGIGFRKINEKRVQGVEYVFDTGKFADLLRHRLLIKLRVYRTYVQGKEERILDQIFEKDGLETLDVWQVEMTARCADNDLKHHC